MSHAIPSDVFHGLKSARWNSAVSMLVWGSAELELHAELCCWCVVSFVPVMGRGRCGRKFALRGLLAMKTGQNSPSKRKTCQIRPFWACRASFIPEQWAPGSRGASFIPEQRAPGSRGESFVPELVACGACRATFVSAVFSMLHAGLRRPLAYAIHAARFGRRCGGAASGVAQSCARRACRPHDVLQLASRGDMPLALRGLGSG